MVIRVNNLYRKQRRWQTRDNENLRLTGHTSQVQVNKKAIESKIMSCMKLLINLYFSEPNSGGKKVESTMEITG